MPDFRLLVFLRGKTDRGDGDVLGLGGVAGVHSRLLVGRDLDLRNGVYRMDQSISLDQENEFVLRPDHRIHKAA